MLPVHSVFKLSHKIFYIRELRATLLSARSSSEKKASLRPRLSYCPRSRPRPPPTCRGQNPLTRVSPERTSLHRHRRTQASSWRRLHLGRQRNDSQSRKTRSPRHKESVYRRRRPPLHQQSRVSIHAGAPAVAHREKVQTLYFITRS